MAIPSGVHKFTGRGKPGKSSGPGRDVSMNDGGSGGRPSVKLPGRKGKDAGGTSNLGTKTNSVRDMSHPVRRGGSATPAGVSKHDGKTGAAVKQPRKGTGLMSHE